MTQEGENLRDALRNAPAEDIGWDEVGGQQVKFETAGDSIEGTLTAKGVVTVSNPQGGENVIGQYYVTNADGPFFFNGGASLDPKLAQVEEGSTIRVTFMGSVQTLSRRTVKTYKVQVRH